MPDPLGAAPGGAPPPIEGLKAPREVRRAVGEKVLWPGRILVASLVVPFALGLSVPPVLEYLPFAASLVLFGLPHGAVDHLVPSRLSGRIGVLPGALAVAGLYAALGCLYLALWFAAPAAAFVFFLGITTYHWGAGDLHALLAFGSNPGNTAGGGSLGRASRALVLLARGAAPMLVPLAAFPGAYRGVAENTVGLFGAEAGALGLAFSPGFRLAAGSAVLALLLLSLVSVARDAGVGRFLVGYGGETALLLAFFAVVPPVLAVGLYFCLWHAPRHVARLVLLDGRGAGALLGAGRAAPALLRFSRDAAPLTVLALALLVGLYFLVPGPDGARGAGDPGLLLAVYLVLVSALTLPHAVVVTLMDGRQGLWRAARAGDAP